MVFVLSLIEFIGIKMLPESEHMVIPTPVETHFIEKPSKKIGSAIWVQCNNVIAHMHCKTNTRERTTVAYTAKGIMIHAMFVRGTRRE